jgi:seryl-tRNA synthetase
LGIHSSFGFRHFSTHGDKFTSSLHQSHLLRGLDHRMRGGFGLGLGVEAVERDAQGAGGVAGADAHGFEDVGGMQSAGVAGGTGGAGDAGLVEQDEHAGGVDLWQAEGAGGVQAVLATTVNAHAGLGGVDEMLKAVAHGVEAGLRAVVEMLAGEFRRRSEADDAGNVLGAAAALSFLPAADEQWRKARTTADVKRPDALRRVKLVPAEAEEIDGHRVDREVDLPNGLNRVRMHQGSGRMSDLDNLAHRRDDSGLVVRPHDGDERRSAGLNKMAQGIEIDAAIGMHWRTKDVAALIFPAPRGFGHSGVLGAGDHEIGFVRPEGTDGGMHGIDGLRAAAGEDDLVRSGPDERRDLLSGPLHRVSGGAAAGVACRRIGKVIPEERQHRLQHGWIDLRGGVGVQIDHMRCSDRLPCCQQALPALDKPRTPANLPALMLDIRLIRDNPDQVKQRLAGRSGDFASLVDEVLAIDAQRRAAETERQKLQSDRNRISKEIGIAKKNGQDTSAIEAEVRGIGSRIDEIGREADASDAKQRDLLLSIPNLPHEACPVGSTAEENPEVRVWGAKPEFAFQPKDHTVVAGALGMIDFEAGVKITGSAFVVYRGAGARLERALISFLLDLHTTQHGYEEISPPLLVKPECLEGTGQLPKFGDQVYHSPEDNLYLIPTAEVPVTNLHRDEIVPLEKLPINYAAYTPCFRREAGSAGLGTRGLIRMHQFDKVELVKITTPETSMAQLESLTGNAEKVLQLLGLHYRVIELCTGDIGFGSAKTYDIEVWAPGQGTYLEVSSCSNFGDYQARRMNLRYKDENGKNRIPHTLNGSGTALARLFVALVETYQQADGTILIPEALRGHFGSEKIG